MVVISASTGDGAQHAANSNGRPQRIGIAPRHESELRWFFGEGQTAVDGGSTFGSMLARAELFSRHAAQTYAHAHGYTIHPSPEAVRGKSGAVIGYRDGETVAITAEVRAPGGYTPDDEDLEKYARVSRRLLAMRRQHGPALAVALECYYGPLGERWRAGPEAMLAARSSDPSKSPGAVAALYHLTPAGQRLLDAEARDAAEAVTKHAREHAQAVKVALAAKGAKPKPRKAAPQVSLTPALAMQNVVHAQRTDRRMLGLARARDQALAMLRDAWTAWRDAVEQERGQ